MPIQPGLSATGRHEVGREDSAAALGSGDLEILGTPRLLAWCEQATVAALAPHVDTSRSTVGTRVELAHERATAIGSTVTVRADLVHVDGRLLRFDVVAEQDTDDGSSVVARGQLTRVLVDRDRFLVRAGITAG